MGKLACGCVTADAKNNRDVRSGHAVSGFVQKFCETHAPENRRKPVSGGKRTSKSNAKRLSAGFRRVNLYLDPDSAAALDRVRAATGYSETEALRVAVRYYHERVKTVASLIASPAPKT